MITRELMQANAQRELMACVGFERALAAINFTALHEVESFGEPGYSVDDGIATIKVRGILYPETGYDMTSWGITGYDILVQYAENARDDAGVDSVVLDVDSVGGYVSRLNTAAAALADIGKPLATVVTGDMYSAAYWLGSISDDVAAIEGAGVGSIGVYVEGFNRTGEIEQRGLKHWIFKSGIWKGAFSPYQDWTDEERARVQSDIDASAQLFFDHVAERRGITSEAVKALEGDSFTAAKALEIGLIDLIVESNDMPSSSSAGAAAGAGAAGTFSQADIDAAVEAAVAAAAANQQAAIDAAIAATQAAADRTAAIAALQTTDEIKALVGGDAFASVDTAALAGLVAAMPGTVAAQLDAQGGAGVTADRVDFAPDAGADKADKQAAALAKIASLKVKAL